MVSNFKRWCSRAALYRRSMHQLPSWLHELRLPLSNDHVGGRMLFQTKFPYTYSHFSIHSAGSNSALSLAEFRVGKPLSHGAERLHKYGPNLMRRKQLYEFEYIWNNIWIHLMLCKVLIINWFCILFRPPERDDYLKS